MIRNDFVSNSSSCSFIIKDSNHEISTSLKNGKYDFLKYISQIPHKRDYDNGSIWFESNSKFSKELQEHKTIDKIILDETEDSISIKNIEIFEKPNELSENDKNYLIRAIEESDRIVFNFGLDDCCEKEGTAKALFALLYYNYNIESIDSDEGPYLNDIINFIDSIKGK